MKSALPYETRCLALIPPSHLITLIIRDCHERVMHNGFKEILAELRTCYWLVKGRKIVKAVISSCNKCRNLEGLNCSPPPIAQLPQFRLEDQHPFTSVGVDFLGPLYVKETKSSTVTSKVYTALYTCATTRAVHLALTTSMTTQAV